VSTGSRHGAGGDPPVDFGALEKIAELAGAGEPEFVTRVVELFLHRVAETAAEVAEALLRGDTECIEERAHEIASSSAQVGAMRLSSACRRIESNACNPAFDLAGAVSDFQREFQAARDALNARFFASGHEPAASSPRILIVEDDPTASLIASRLIEGAGYVVEVATDGRDALQRLESIEVDALITDLRMPRVGGRELCERLRSQERWRQLPIFVATGVVGSDQLDWIETMTGVELVEKPMEIAALIRRLDSILRPSTCDASESGA